MDNARKVVVNGNTIYQGDCGVDVWSFEVDKIYNDIDLSNLNGFLKLSFADETNDKILLDKQIDGDKLHLTWNVGAEQTICFGECDAQIVFEAMDLTVVFNSQIFKINIKESIENSNSSTNIVTAFRQLQLQLNDDITFVKGVINDGIVRSVNGETGEVVVTAEGIGAIRQNYVDDEFAKLFNGSYTAKNSQNADFAIKAEQDENGLNISENYVLKISQRKTEWEVIANRTTSTETNKEYFDLNGNFKKLYIVVTLADQLSGGNPNGISYYPIINTEIGFNEKNIYNSNIAYAQSSLNGEYFMFEIECFGTQVRVKRFYMQKQSPFEYEVITSGHCAMTLGIDIAQKYLNKINFTFYENNSDTEKVYQNVNFKILGIRYND